MGILMICCDKNCDGCLSPEMKIYDKSKEININDIVRMISSIPNRIEGVTISGGEPFYNPAALCELVSKLNDITDDILVFSGYTYEELIVRNDENIIQVFKIISAIIDGPFSKKLHSDIGLKGSSNQRIIAFKHFDKYENVDFERRD